MSKEKYKKGDIVSYEDGRYGIVDYVEKCVGTANKIWCNFGSIKRGFSTRLTYLSDFKSCGIRKCKLERGVFDGWKGVPSVVNYAKPPKDLFKIIIPK